MEKIVHGQIVAAKKGCRSCLSARRKQVRSVQVISVCVVPKETDRQLTGNTADGACFLATNSLLNPLGIPATC